MPIIRCVSCHIPFPDDKIPYRCPSCGGIYDYDAAPVYQVPSLSPTLPGMWRYMPSFALPPGSPVVSLGEGNTPLVWTDYKGAAIGLKLESQNPTGSYKDRGSAVLASFLVSRGVQKALEDSSGNAGASFAAYAARAGVSARVFVPESASGPKRTQIEMFGADLVRVPGARSKAAEAVLWEVEQGGVYASHAYIPVGLMGIATIAYELVGSLTGDYLDTKIDSGMVGKAPGTIIAPVGHGGLLLGIIRGFTALKNAGVINQSPCMVAVQAAGCAPVVAAGRKGITAMSSIQEGATIAEGVRVRNPVRVQALLDETEPGKRDFLEISEEDIRLAHRELARRGFYVEPTSALVWAALNQVFGRFPQPYILILSGSGLKYQPSPDLK